MSAPPSQTPARAQDESLTSVLVALAANTAIAIAKGAAAALTGSPALLAETLHTVADAGNEVFLYVAIRRSRRPADASHPFGYGPERYFWALLAAIGIFIVGGAVSIWDGIRALLNPPELEAFWVGVVVLVVALVLDGISRVVALRQLRVQAARREVSLRELLRESPDPTVVTVYFEDTVDVLGAVLALVALVLHQVTGSAVPDALASIVIGGLLCYLATRLTRRNRELLTNQSVPERYVERMRDRLESQPEIDAVMRLGGRLPRTGGGAGRGRRADGRRPRRRRRERGAGSSAGRRGSRCPGGRTALPHAGPGWVTGPSRDKVMYALLVLGSIGAEGPAGREARARVEAPGRSEGRPGARLEADPAIAGPARDPDQVIDHRPADALASRRLGGVHGLDLARARRRGASTRRPRAARRQRGS